MKVYKSDIPFNPDYTNYNREREIRREDEHMAAQKAYLISIGYTGKNTGRIYKTPVADGYAMYMMAEGSRSVLIHLPYRDAYHNPNVRYIPKKEILRQIEASENMAKLFVRKTG